MQADDGVRAGQAVYTPATLKIYDAFVLGFSNRFLWRCPTPELEALYARNVSARHLDVGVGTGYFLDRAPWPVAAPAVTLVDLNPHSLDAAARRIARYVPETVVADVLEPLPLQGPFDSVAMCYLLHCLPGTLADKAVAFDHARAVMAPGAKVFGATILDDGGPLSPPARALMNFYNRKGIFSNAADGETALRGALEDRFTNVRVTRRGVVALFEARHG